MAVKKPRFSTMIIVCQSVLLVAALIALGFFMYQNFISSIEAKKYAYESGCAEATRNYARGNYSIYEMKLYKVADDSGPIPDDGSTKPSGKMEGRIPIRYFLVDADTPKLYRDIEQQFIDGYNFQMHAYFESPELYDKNGFRIPMHELHDRTY